MKKIIVVAIAVLLLSLYFTFVGVWIAPFAVGLFRDEINYNIALGVLLSVLSIITIVLLCRKRWRVYTLLFIPHLIALGLIMVYVGCCLYYMGDGFIRVRIPYWSCQIRTTSGHVVFDHAYDITYYERNGIFRKYRKYAYDKSGNCIFTMPSDDEKWVLSPDGFCSLKHFDSPEVGCSSYTRERIFDFDGHYIITRHYSGYYSGPNSGFNDKLIREYTEDVTELPDGIKKFNEKKESYSEKSENQTHYYEERSEPVERTTNSPQPAAKPKECKRCHGVGTHNKIKCPTCNGRGVIKNELYNPYDDFLKTFSPEVTCPYCDGDRYFDCPGEGGLLPNPFSKRSQGQRVNASGNQYNSFDNSSFNNNSGSVRERHVKDPCGACNGTGLCTSCGGKGFTYNPMTDNYYSCGVCNQSGKCVACRGAGWL